MTNQNEFTWITEVHLVEHDPQWPMEFEAEAERLEGLLGERAVGIHHIGSTAVPGLDAKPVVDLMVEVSDLREVQQMTDVFEEAGYEVLGENGIPGRHFITRNEEGERTHDVNIFESGHDEITRMILFRDRMRENPDEATAYSELKNKLASMYKNDPIRYTQGKSDFILGAVDAQKEFLETRN